MCEAYSSCPIVHRKRTGTRITDQTVTLTYSDADDPCPRLAFQGLGDEFVKEALELAFATALDCAWHYGIGFAEIKADPEGELGEHLVHQRAIRNLREVQAPGPNAIRLAFTLDGDALIHSPEKTLTVRLPGKRGKGFDFEVDPPITDPAVSALVHERIDKALGRRASHDPDVRRLVSLLPPEQPKDGPKAEDPSW